MTQIINIQPIMIFSPNYIPGYKIETILGKGGYGKVYKAIHSSTQRPCAIKISSNKESLSKEFDILLEIQHLQGFPHIYDYTELPTEDALILELLSHSLSFKSKKKLFSLKCVSAIGIQLIDLLEKLHDSGILHRDIKPSNFLIALNQKSIKLIDYGLATHLLINSQHKEFKTHKKCKGTACFASINTHLGFSSSRRDDLESVCYSLISLLNGSLPWDSLPKVTGFKKWQMILSQKFAFSANLNSTSIPAEFTTLLQYTRKLSFTQRPNYCYMKTLLSKFVHLNNLYVHFDWYDLKSHTNLGNSQQIVEGATVVTKLKRRKRGLRDKRKREKSSFDKIKVEKYRTMEKLPNEHYSRDSLADIRPLIETESLVKKIGFRMSADIISKNHLQLPMLGLNHTATSEISMKVKKVKTSPEIWNDDEFQGNEEEKGAFGDGQASVETKEFNLELIQLGIDERVTEYDTQLETHRSLYPEFRDREAVMKGREKLDGGHSEKNSGRCYIF